MSNEGVLGKRKERDEKEAEFSRSTFFVSNLPYSATTSDLQTLFSEFAPVRSAFVVLSGNVSKGVGYVSFAIKEDAKMAMESIEKDGIKLNGRTLRVQWADKKQKDGEEKPKKEPKEPSIRVPKPKLEKDPDAIRTILMSGIPKSVDQKTLWKKLRKLDGAESVEVDENVKGSAQALFSNPSAASHAVDKLHAHIYKGSILSVTLKKRIESLAKPRAHENGKTLATPNRVSRLIVRNVPWDITERDLRALFVPFGPIYSITIPSAPVDSDESASKKRRSRGFVFIWFYSKKDAERAIAGVNGKEVVAGAISAPTMNKKERARKRREERVKKEREKAIKKARALSGEVAEVDREESEEASESDEGDNSEEEEKERTVKARVLAVDWALSKEKWEEAKAGMADEGEESGDEERETSVSSEEVEDDSQADTDATSEALDVDGDVRMEDSPPQEEEQDLSTTLFIRNVPYTATDDDLRTLFTYFGPVRYARVVIEHDTGRSRGTAFVCFIKPEDAAKCFEKAQTVEQETGLANTGVKKANPFSLGGLPATTNSLLTPDPSSSLAQPLVLHGRTLSVSRALPRNSADALKQSNERLREKSDKRNLYLLREGVPFPSTPAASMLSESEVEKRLVNFQKRKALIKSNPSLYVSKMRLSVRGLPNWVSEKGLRKLGSWAAAEFEKSVERGDREALNQDELEVDPELILEKANIEDEGEDRGFAKKGPKKNKREKATGIVKQAKIVRQTDRIDALTGKARSRGYGFLELSSHADSLRVLRYVNGNVEVLSKMEDWWLEELEGLISMLEKDVTSSEDKEKKEEKTTRVKRMKEELSRIKEKRQQGKKGLKTLALEFSIENAQVVKRRSEKIEASRTDRKSMKDDRENGDERHSRVGTRPTKRRKLESGASVPAEGKVNESRKSSSELRAKSTVDVTEAKGASERPQNALGSIIGRKRKMRKSKGKA